MLNWEQTVAFSSSWLIFRLLLSFMHGMSQLNSNLWDVTALGGSYSIMQESLVTGVGACERSGVITTCSQLFSSRELHEVSAGV